WTLGPRCSGKGGCCSSRSQAKGAGPCREAGQTWANPRPKPRPARPWRNRATGCSLSGCSRPTTATGTATRPSPTTSTSWFSRARSWTKCLHPTWIPTECASSVRRSFLSSRSPALPSPRSHASSSSTATLTVPPTST
ncbi:Putative ADP-ribose pyrophosphatase YjhB, partial [uncultured Rubrobacteraceae bacterium]